MTTASDTPMTRLVRSYIIYPCRGHNIYIYISLSRKRKKEKEIHLSRWNQQVQTRRTRLVSRIVRMLRRVVDTATLRKWISFSFFPISIFHDNNFMGRRKSKVSVGKADDGRLLPIVFPAEACPESFNHLTPATRRIRSAGVPRRRRFHLTRQPVGASRFSKADGDPASRGYAFDRSPPIFLFSNLDQIWCNV